MFLPLFKHQIKTFYRLVSFTILKQSGIIFATDLKRHKSLYSERGFHQMASYKQPCFHCGALIEPDARFCPACASQSPFGYTCPNCLKTIEKGVKICPRCGISLYISCPHCQKQTFVQDKCEQCGKSLMVTCTNKRCGAVQFFLNAKCNNCGNKIKK